MSSGSRTILPVVGGRRRHRPWTNVLTVRRRAAGVIVASFGGDGEGAGTVPFDTDETTANQRAEQGYALIWP